MPRWNKTSIAACLTIQALLPASLAAQPNEPSASKCYGSPASGALEGAVRLPDEGDNFEVYRWREGKARLYVHSDVAVILKTAFEQFHRSAPDVRFVVGETGFQGGGPLPGHVTHQNGTSVDLFVPVRELPANDLVLFPNDFRNGYGYKVRFDQFGASTDGRFQVDFEILGEYIYQLKVAASNVGRGIDRVVLTRDFQLRLGETKRWTDIRWVRYFDDPNDRHDNHVHVDFDIPCRFMWERRSSK
jgi:penicillin-insensitive murein endopeptidase